MQAQSVTLDRISKRYGTHVALDDVSLSVRAGEFLTLLGPSGSGKTTLLMAIAGFLRPDVGHVFVGDQDVVRLPPNRRNIGVVFQSYALFPHMSVFNNVMFPLRARSVPAAVARERALAALTTVQLAGLAHRGVAELSGGQRQRVALARAIVFEPRLMLMDEPLSALDRGLREDMQLELRQLHARLGVTTIYVTHDQREAMTLSDRIAVMQAGRIVQLDTPQAIYAEPRDVFVAGFMGEANLIPLTMLCGGAVQFTMVPGATHAMVRAEQLLLAKPEGDALRFVANVQSVVFQGESWLVHAMMANGHFLIARIPESRGDVRNLAPGQETVFYAQRRFVRALGPSQGGA